jgi:hypothetical protein
MDSFVSVVEKLATSAVPVVVWAVPSAFVEYEVQSVGYVARKISVAADNRDPLPNGLRDGYAVYVVFVVGFACVVFDDGYFREFPQVSGVDPFYLDFQLLGNKVDDILGGFTEFDAEFARLPQKYQFFHTCGRNVYEVAFVFKNSLNFRSEVVLTIDGAEVKDMRVDIIAVGPHILNTFLRFGSGGKCAVVKNQAPNFDIPSLFIARSSFSATKLSALAFCAADSFREAFIFLTASAALTSISAGVTQLRTRHSALVSLLRGFCSSSALSAKKPASSSADRSRNGLTALALAAVDNAADRFLTVFLTAAALDTFLAGFTAVLARVPLFAAIFMFRSLLLGGRDTVTVVNIIDGRLSSQVNLLINGGIVKHESFC